MTEPPGMFARARAALPAIGVSVALIVPPAAAWAIWGDGEHPRVAEQRIALPDPEPRRPARVDPLVRPPGEVLLEDAGPVTRYAATQALEKVDVALYLTGGVVRAQTITAQEGGLRMAVWRFTVNPDGDPAALKEAIDSYYRTRGWLSLPPSENRPAVLMTPSVAKDVPGQTPMLRAHYVLGDDLIRVDTNAAGPEAPEPAFDRLLDTQLAAYPPSEVG